MRGGVRYHRNVILAKFCKISLWAPKADHRGLNFAGLACWLWGLNTGLVGDLGGVLAYFEGIGYGGVFVTIWAQF